MPHELDNHQPVDSDVISRERESTHAPDLRIVPVNDRVDAHKGGPAAVRRVKVRQGGAVRVRPPGPDEDGLDARAIPEIYLKGGLHGQLVACDLEAIGSAAAVDKGVDGRKGAGRHDVD